MKEKKLGGGIITCVIINICYYLFLTLGLVVNVFFRDSVEQNLIQIGMANQVAEMPPTLSFVILLVFAVLILISSILILCKKKTGVYLFFTVIVLNLIYSIITNGFKPALLIGLILPGLLGLFIYKRRSVFGFSNPDEDQSIDA
ncbi:hypothetical protein KPL39_09400 [Clostridium gasigenes]|uniref:hypothetical protein n=1 Tax=Clostridium gasigenes TaxID=94869 RepID=UPI001C0CEF7D|nr:hypothetical protein [Clostridium gasigenes]MBU3136485.1 hypothetical protein [Clostridium gasigenes]